VTIREDRVRQRTPSRAALGYWLISALLALVLPGPAGGQTADKVYRLGALMQSAGSVERIRAYMLPVLAREGFVEGRNLMLEVRIGTAAELPAPAEGLLATKPDAILANGGVAIRAVRQHSDTVPTVGSAIGGDPVAAGFAASLARPGGNVTGVVMLAPDLDAKRLELLHQAVPTARRIAALGTDPTTAKENISAVRGVGEALGLELSPFYAEVPADYPGVFAAMRSTGTEGLTILSAPDFFTNASTLAALALEAGLPTVCEWRKMAEQGCLLGYGPDYAELNGRTANYVARIFGGASPGDLPIEQPTHFEFAVNMKTAKALGLAIPPAILARADDVIE
jgi:putative tryptophan/tyrosine transport system substrate-binding protein